MCITSAQLMWQTTLGWIWSLLQSQLKIHLQHGLIAIVHLLH